MDSRPWLTMLRTLRMGHSHQLPRDNNAALNMLLPMVLQKEHRKVADLINNSPGFNINTGLPKIERTLLHMAANIGAAECVAVLLHAGADPNIRDSHGVVPLHFAARNGFKDCSKLLLNKGADPKIPDNEGLTAVHWAALSGRTELLADFLSRHIDINIQDRGGQTALHVASMNGHFKTVEYLIEQGASINQLNHHQHSPLILACKEGHRKCMELLLLHGANPSSKCSQGMSVLYILVSQRYLDCVYSLTQSHPTQLCSLLEALKSSELQYKNVIDCIERICYKNKALVWKIWETLLSLTVNTGKEVMSNNLDTNVSQGFLRLVKALKHLSLLDIISHWIYRRSSSQHDVSEVDNQQSEVVSLPTSPLSRSSQLFYENPQLFSKLDEVWSILTKWMDLFSNEIVRKRKSDISISELLALSVPEDGGTPGTLLSAVTITDGDEDLLDLFADKICTLIEAYHLWSKGTSYISEFERFITVYSHVLKVLLAHNSMFIFNQLKFFLESPLFMKQFNSIRKIVYQKDFVLRKKWFYENLYDGITPDETISSAGRTSLKINRRDVFNSSCEQIQQANTTDLRKKLVITFDGDQGIGTGVRREWFSILTSEMLNEDYALFTHSNDGMTFQPSHISDIQEDHLSYFRFAGIIMGLSLYHQNVISIHFTRSFYKHILGIPSDYTDVASIDPGYADSLQWLLDNDISQIEDLELTFSEDQDHFGEARVVELKEGGSNIRVTEENKTEYVELITEYKMTSAIKPQITSFLDGFHSIVPASLVAIFNENELELLMSGVAELDVDDWEAHTEYNVYTSQDQVILWFWTVVREFSPSERAQLLQFCTGCSRVPLGGFAALQGAGEIMPFTISKSHDRDNLPTASTCFNLLKLPEYTSLEMMRQRLTPAIRFGSEGFDFV